jgi:hypothetical protein
MDLLHSCPTMAPRKRQRNSPGSPPPASRTIPTDLLLENATRSDVRTIVRFAAACRTLRSRILAAPCLPVSSRASTPAAAAPAIRSSHWSTRWRPPPRPSSARTLHPLCRVVPPTSSAGTIPWRPVVGSSSSAELEEVQDFRLLKISYTLFDPYYSS